MNPEYSYPSQKSQYYIENKHLYQMVKYMILSYDELCRQKYNIQNSSPPPSDGLPKGNAVGNPIENKVISCATVSELITAINQVCYIMRSIHTIEKPLKAFCSYPAFSIAYSKRTKTIAPCERTWIRFRNEFIWRVAKKMNFI